MTKSLALIKARRAAEENGLPMSLINDPAGADAYGPYFYCPSETANMLHPNGTVEEIVFGECKSVGVGPEDVR